jgi:hypothetical protein
VFVRAPGLGTLGGASVVPAVPRSDSSPVQDVGVRLVQVSKAFGDVFAVDHIDLEVVDGGR